MENLGTFIKLNRLMQNMTISTVAKETNIDPSQISKIERGYETSLEKTKKILDFLDIDFDNIFCNTEEINCLSNDILEKFYYHFLLEELDFSIEKLNKLCYVSFYNFDALIINLINNVFLNKNEELSNKYISILETLYTSLSNTQKSIYLLCLTKLHSQKSNMKLSKYYLEKSTAYITSKKIKSIYYYCSSLIHLNMFDLFKSLEDINIAITLFEQTNNYYMTTQCLLIKSQIAIFSKSFKEASSILLEIEKINRRNFHHQYLYIQILNLKSEIFVQQKKFDDFINFSKTLTKSQIVELEKNETYIINKLLSYFSLEMYSECKSFCQHVYTTDFSTLPNTLIEYFFVKTSFKKSSRRNISLLKKCLKLSLNNHYYYFYHIIVDLLTKEYLESKNPLQVYECYKLVREYKI